MRRAFMEFHLLFCHHLGHPRTCQNHGVCTVLHCRQTPPKPYIRNCQSSISRYVCQCQRLYKMGAMVAEENRHHLGLPRTCQNHGVCKVLHRGEVQSTKNESHWSLKKRILKPHLCPIWFSAIRTRGQAAATRDFLVALRSDQKPSSGKRDFPGRTCSCLCVSGNSFAHPQKASPARQLHPGHSVSRAPKQ